MLKIRRPLGRLIFNMGIAIPGKTVFLIETAPWSLSINKTTLRLANVKPPDRFLGMRVCQEYYVILQNLFEFYMFVTIDTCKNQIWSVYIIQFILVYCPERRCYKHATLDFLEALHERSGRNYIDIFLSEVFIHPGPNANSDLVNLPLTRWQRWMNASPC